MNNYIKSSILFAVLLSVSSCGKSFLDTTPYTAQSSDQAIGTETDLAIATTGVYNRLLQDEIYGRSTVLYGDLLAETAVIAASNSGRYTIDSEYTFGVTSSYMASLYTMYYKVILMANNVINADLASSTVVDQNKAEARALRALAYFDLLRFYARPYTDNPEGLGVPLLLAYDITAALPRSTVSEVYAQIEADLNDAFTSIGDSYSSSARISRYAVRGLQAKVALTKGDYASALTYAADVIDNGGFALLSYANFANYWASATASTAKGETLFELEINTATNNGSDDLVNFTHQEGGYGDLVTTSDFYNSFTATDIRKSLIFIGARSTHAENLNATTPIYIINKYQAPANDKSNVKVLRLSDIYLIAAEAAYNEGNETQARTYLNTLVAQRDQQRSYTSTGATLLENILEERKKELAFEGDRLHTLNRLRRDITRPAAYFSTTSIPYSNYRRVFPFPESELDYNPNVVQNPEY